MSENQTTGKVMKRKNPYMVLDVTPFRDTRLSWKAKGLMTYFLDKPDGWHFILEHIYTQAPDGKSSVRSGIKELMRFGYVVRVAFRQNKKVDHYEFLVYEQPVAYPSEEPIHVDIAEWKAHLANGGDIDITLFTENRKAGKPLDTSLVSENLKAGFLEAGNQPLLITKDIEDDDGSAKVSHPWETDFQYKALRQQFTAVGASDIRKHEEHYPKFLEAKNKLGFGKLCELADEYIKKVQAGEHPHKKRGPQIVWFLNDGWQNFGLESNEKSVFKSEKKESPRRKLKIIDVDMAL